MGSDRSGSRITTSTTSPPAGRSTRSRRMRPRVGRDSSGWTRRPRSRYMAARRHHMKMQLHRWASTGRASAPHRSEVHHAVERRQMARSSDVYQTTATHRHPARGRVHGKVIAGWQERSHAFTARPEEGRSHLTGGRWQDELYGTIAFPLRSIGRRVTRPRPVSGAGVGPQRCRPRASPAGGEHRSASWWSTSVARGAGHGTPDARLDLHEARPTEMTKWPRASRPSDAPVLDKGRVAFTSSYAATRGVQILRYPDVFTAAPPDRP